MIATLLWTKRATESGIAVGMIMFAGSITSILMPLGGALADRMSRVRILVLLDCISGASVLGLALVFYFLSDDHPAIIPALLLVNLSLIHI